MKIRAKIFLFIFVTSFIVFAVVIGIIVFNYRSDALKEAKRLADSFALQSAKSVKSTLEQDLSVAKTLSMAFNGFDKIDNDIRQPIYKNIIGNILKGHPEYLAVWMSWELRFIDPTYKKPYGRQRTVTVIESGNLNFIVDTVELNGDVLGSMYHNQKISMKDLLTDPYFYVYSPEVGGDSILETSVAASIIKDGEFVGLAGIDITLSRFQKLTAQIQPFKNSFAFLVANNSRIITFPNQKTVGDSINNIFPEFIKFEVAEKIKKGNIFSFEYEDSTSYSNYVSFAPVKVGNTGTPWSICLIAPTKVIEEEAIANFNMSLFIGFIGLMMFSIVSLIIAQRITLPLKQSTAILKDLDKGIIDFSKKVKTRSNDELAEMGKSLNHLMTTLHETANFAKKIGNGDFSSKYEAISKEDVLGNALIDMKNNLQRAQEQEDIRHLERKKLNWSQDGVTELGEVLRKSSDNFEEYLFNIISKVVTYLAAEQGGIFLLNDEDSENSFLELKTAFAYDRKKVLESRIEIGESLVGRCFQEKELIHLTNLPDGYTFITSGLGGHNPRSLLLLPLMFESEIFGVIEIASLRELADFEIDFLQSIGERIASSISVAHKNIKTKDLLEKFQIQTNEIEERERSIKENIIKLQKAQEEAELREIETEGVINALIKIGSVVWYDMNGTILKIKDPGLFDAGLTESDMIGKNQSEFAKEAKENPEEYKRFWDDLREGNSRRRLFKAETNNGIIWISEIYTPIKDNKGEPYKVINIGFNISEQKSLEEKIKVLKAEIKELKSNM